MELDKISYILKAVRELDKRESSNKYRELNKEKLKEKNIIK